MTAWTSGKAPSTRWFWISQPTDSHIRFSSILTPSNCWALQNTLITKAVNLNVKGKEKRWRAIKTDIIMKQGDEVEWEFLETTKHFLFVTMHNYVRTIAPRFTNLSFFTLATLFNENIHFIYFILPAAKLWFIQKQTMCFLAYSPQMRWTICHYDDTLTLSGNLEEKMDAALKPC